MRAAPGWKPNLALIKPKIVVCLGATAAQTMMGPAFRLTKQRGRFFEHPSGALLTATVHPSAILRAPDDAQRHAEYRDFVADLQDIREHLGQLQDKRRAASRR